MKSIGLGVLILVLSAIYSSAAVGEVVIVAHKSVGVDQVDARAFQEMALGKRVQWRDGAQVRFVVMKDRELHEQFLRSFVRKSPSQWDTYWRRMMFTGRGLPPKTLDSSKAILDFVSQTEGAVGYVDAEAVSETVKVLEIR